MSRICQIEEEAKLYRAAFAATGQPDPFASQPCWFACAAARRASVIVDGRQEPFTLKEAMKLPEWPEWRMAIEKEILGLIAAYLWT